MLFNVCFIFSLFTNAYHPTIEPIFEIILFGSFAFPIFPMVAVPILSITTIHICFMYLQNDHVISVWNATVLGALYLAVYFKIKDISEENAAIFEDPLELVISSDIIYKEEDGDAHISMCPITLSPPQSPVRASDGHVYEHKAIMEWMRTNMTSPVTREVLRNELVRIKKKPMPSDP